MKNFFKTVAIVTVFSVCEKFLGFMYRIYLSRTIGAEGVGLYQVSLSVFAFLLTVICSGTPVTVSRLMTKYKAEKNYERVYKVITAGISYTLLVALPVCMIFFLCKDKFSFLFADERCLTVFLIVLPGLIFTSVYSILRGVFWGNKDFMPYSVIELLEEICMIFVGVFLINRATDTYSGAKRAGVAVLISYLFSFSLATAVFFFRKNKLKNPKSEFRPLLHSALPVTAMRTVNSLSVSLVSVVLPIQLIKCGFTNSEALSLYGSAMGQALPILYIPTTLIGSFILVLIPEISENFYGKNGVALKNNIEKAVKFTAILSCAFIPTFFVCGEEIGVLIFNSTDCGKFLTASSFIVFFMGISNITTSILDSMGYEKTVLLFCSVGGALMLLSVLILPRFIGIYSLAVGYGAVFLTTALLDLILLAKKCPVKPVYIKSMLTAFALTLPDIFLGLMLEKILLKYLGTFLTFAVCGTVLTIFYIAMSVGFGLLDISIIKKKFIKNKKGVAI